MSAQTRIIPNVEADQGFGLLKDIVEMVKNPKAIEAAYQARKKAAELTDDEVRRADEARALITQAEALRAEIESEKATLVCSIAVHHEAVEEHKKIMDNFSSEVKKKTDELDAITKSQNEEADRLKGEWRALNERTSSDEKTLAEKADKLRAREESVLKDEAANLKEANRLSELSDKLKAKAKRLLAEAQLDA